MGKWLLRKTSCSKFNTKGKYSDYRNSKFMNLEEAPTHLPMSYRVHTTAKQEYTPGLDTSLVERWLATKVGMDFDKVYSQFLKKIQPKYLSEYRNCIFEYVEKNKLKVSVTSKNYIVDAITNELRRSEMTVN